LNTRCFPPAWIVAFAATAVSSPCLASPPPGLTVPGAAAVAETGAAVAKTDVAGARLLLPLYLLDTTDPDGVTTLFAVRNQLATPIEVELRYYQADAPQAPQRTDTVALAAKAVAAVNLRFVSGLSADPDGVARGYVVAEGLTEGAVIQGDYFRVTPGEDFASGFRMLNADPASLHNDLCGLFTVRFLNGGGFDSGTRFIIWLEADQAPDPASPVFAYSAYAEDGELVLSSTYFADEVVFEVEASDLFVGPLQTDFGAVEFQFVDRVGHVSAILSAQDRYSVGLEAFCGDF